MKNLLIIGLLVGFIINGQTGVILRDSLVEEGYVLFTPNSSTETYLIDNCGELVHQWSSAVRPGNSVYLYENGDLLRTGKTTSTHFTAGGYGGMIEKYDWDGNLLFQYVYDNDSVRQHHDVVPMNNGNILVLAWELKDYETSILNGRDSSLLDDNELWPEQIIEIEPVDEQNFNIVWEWHAWDHLIQDYDSTKLNYGVVADHPELMDINYTRTGDASDDWMHANALDYNEEKDQIVMSLRKMDEIWIIDHSTTTEEAAGHTGGNSGMGGDIIYRWGNPKVYQRGDDDDQKLFGQHNPNWIANGTYEGSIILFNNGSGRGYSSVDIITPPVNGYNFDITAGQAFGPIEQDWIYTDPDDSTAFFGTAISGAHITAADRVMICEGPSGHFFEIDYNGNKYWDYVSPVTNSGIVSSTDAPVGNGVFRCTKFPGDYPAFTNQNLVGMGQIELNPDTTICAVPTGLAGVYQNELKYVIIDHQLSLTWEGHRGQVEVYGLTGQLLKSKRLVEQTEINLSDISDQLVLVRIADQENQYVIKILK